MLTVAAVVRRLGGSFPVRVVPVAVDAVLFWKIVDPKKAGLDVADYQSAISWASQTALRDVSGKTMHSDMLEGRDTISNSLQKGIDERTEPWK
jgi:regulator of protease activity HflC (stomatin/prohibitin superfamily)